MNSHSWLCRFLVSTLLCVFCVAFNSAAAYYCLPILERFAFAGSMKMSFNYRQIFKLNLKLKKPKSSEVLTYYLTQCGEPPWTSYFVKYNSIEDDQWGKSHFNWKTQNSNYHILRTGCYPYIKYHCTKRPVQNLVFDDYFFRFIKVLNLGIPCLAYGVAAIFLIRHTELVKTPKGNVEIYFLYPEDKGSIH